MRPIPLASVTGWEMGPCPFFASLTTVGLLVFSPGSACRGTPCCHVAFDLPLLAEASEWEGGLPAILSHKHFEGGEPGRRLDTAKTVRGLYLGLYIQW